MIAGKPNIENVSMTLANTEYSYNIPSGVNKVLLKLRDGGVDLKLSYTSGTSGTTYITIQSGSVKSIDDMKGGLTIYFQSDTASQVLEIEIWK
jgi:hypothetical protein